jgi:hypothetical protein
LKLGAIPFGEKLRSVYNLCRALTRWDIRVDNRAFISSNISFLVASEFLDDPLDSLSYE